MKRNYRYVVIGVFFKLLAIIYIEMIFYITFRVMDDFTGFDEFLVIFSGLALCVFLFYSGLRLIKNEPGKVGWNENS